MLIRGVVQPVHLVQVRGGGPAEFREGGLLRLERAGELLRASGRLQSVIALAAHTGQLVRATRRLQGAIALTAHAGQLGARPGKLVVGGIGAPRGFLPGGF